jgi:hypothetical protein
VNASEFADEPAYAESFGLPLFFLFNQPDSTTRASFGAKTNACAANFIPRRHQPQWQRRSLRVAARTARDSRFIINRQNRRQAGFRISTINQLGRAAGHLQIPLAETVAA